MLRPGRKEPETASQEDEMKNGFIKHSAHELDFELNIASIIDCFVVLIAFVLISSSFFAIGIVDAEVASAGDVASISDETGLVVELKSDRSIWIRSNASKPERIAAEGKSWNYEGMSATLQRLKEELPELKSAILIADNSVAYRDVMRSMDAVKKDVSSVSLGGF
jgi:biopolymer transport protein ExbD